MERNNHSMPRYERHHFDEFPEAADCKEAIQQERYKSIDLMGRINAASAAKFRNSPITAETLADLQAFNSQLESILSGMEQSNG